MRILLLTDNYPPETNASALRSSAHARRWTERGADVTVLTSFPNFPEGRLHPGYRQRLRDRKVVDGVEVVRVPTLIFPNGGFVKRIVDFVSYAVSASVAALFVRRPDVVVATSPQFFAAVAGWVVSVLHRRPFVFELRDLWPDSIVAVGAMKEGLAIRALRKLEHFLYRRADLIVAVTESFRSHLVASGIPAGKIGVVRNGVDLARFTPGEPPATLRGELGLGDRLVVSYIGTIGMAHGLEMLIDVAEDLAVRAPQVAFLIVGAGAGLERLRAAVAERRLDNVVFVERVEHDRIVHFWRLSDLTLVLLRDDPVFRTVIPSKIFEAMATGTPIVTNVAGELETLLSPLGSAVQVPPDGDGLADAILSLARDPAARARLSAAGVEAARLFRRERQADDMLDLLEDCAARRRSASRPERP